MEEQKRISNSDVLQRLRADIVRRFSRPELDLLCSDLDATHAIAPGPIENEVLQLVQLLVRQDRLSDLIGKLKDLRPETNWDEFALKSLPGASSSANPSKPNKFVPHDVFTRHERGLAKLGAAIPADHPSRGAFDTHQNRLVENIDKARRFGDTSTRQAERAEVFDALNRISHEVTGQSFNEWMSE